MLRLGLAPSFDAYTKKGDSSSQQSAYVKGEDNRLGGVPATRKKIQELIQALVNLQQNIDIPAPTLQVDPLIQLALDDAARKGVPPSIDLIDAKHLADSSFMNRLQGQVNGWIQEIQKTTKTDRDPAAGTARQEINFWLSMEHALKFIEEQLKTDGVTLTLEVLRHAKRYQATVSFTSDTGLSEKFQTVEKYNLVMRDFPLVELETATTLDKVADSIRLIFSHLNKKIRLSSYPIRRALPLVEAISADLDTRIHSILNGRMLMHFDYPQFQKVMAEADAVCRAWDEHQKEFTNVAREVLRRRNEKFIPIKINPKHIGTKDRLEYIGRFRNNHEQLQRTIVNVLGVSAFKDGMPGSDGIGAVVVDELGDVDPVDEVAQAYAALKDVDVLDLAPEGTRIWENAEATYDERTSRVENSIIAQLRDRLAMATGSANEMFRVFSKFNALFVRPKIRSAISQYQTQLIGTVKDDIDKLHERFKQQYGASEAHAMAQLRDLPPVSGAIIWARQIERQLDGYMRRVEDVLGPEWRLHTEGEQLAADSMNFRQKLDTKPIFSTWYQDVARKDINIRGRLFKIDRIRSQGNIYELVVNFDPQVITLFKEVRNLWWLGFQVPHAINNVSKDAKRVYPYAVTLMETVRIFTQTVRSISEVAEVSPLLNGYQNDAEALIQKGVALKWESFVNVYEVVTRSTFAGPAAAPVGKRNESMHVKFVQDFASAISALQNKTSTLAIINATVQQTLKELESCPYVFKEFETRLQAIQKAVDQLSLENYSNLQWWVDEMNAKLNTILMTRLRHAIKDWLEVFENPDVDHSQPAEGEFEERLRVLPKFEPLGHEVSIRNQTIFLNPPLNFAEARWLVNLEKWLAVVCSQKQLNASRYKLRLGLDVEDTESYFSHLPAHCVPSLLDVHAAMKAKVAVVSEYVDIWLQYQSLWDLRPEQVFDELQEDLPKWLQIISEVLKNRSTFDTSEVSKEFGHITIKYEQVQNKVNSRFDQWQQDIVVKFAQLLGGRMNLLYSEISEARKDLEGQALEASSTQQAVTFITTVQQCKRRAKAWEVDVDLFRQGETTLKRQRRVPQKDWLSMEMIDNEWQALTQVLERKSRIVEEQSEALRSKIQAEDALVNHKIEEIREQWAEEKPLSGNTPPDEASKILIDFEGRLTKLQQEAEGVSKAKESLDLSPSPENVLPSIVEELGDLKLVWANLMTISDHLNELRDQLWASVQPRKIRGRLEEITKKLKDQSARMRNYAAFEHMQNRH